MRITYHNGKAYRAYSPEEFFKSPDATPAIFNMDRSKPKSRNIKEGNVKNTNDVQNIKPDTQ
jgi:hypothetical protein